MNFYFRNEFNEARIHDSELVKHTCEDGRIYWSLDDTLQSLHRDEGPAIIYPNGNLSWYQNGVLHREGAPACTGDFGEMWYLNGEPHRDDGPAFTVHGNRDWYKHGERHREDGPAVDMACGHKEWWVNGKQHREDGPAVERRDGAVEWWWQGTQVSEALQKELRKPGALPLHLRRGPFL